MASITYVSPLQSPERILTFGPQGVGKSTAILTVARRLPDCTFRVIDNDYSASYSRALETDFADLSNVEVAECDPDDFEDFMQSVIEYADATKERDWLVVDPFTETWDGVQGWFTEEVHGKDIADYFVEVRKKKAEAKKEKKALGALDGWMDWPVIKKQYRRLYRAIFRQCRGHVYITAELQRVSDDDDRETRNLYGPYGVRPKGEKSLGHKPSTVLMLTKTRADEYEMTTIKDRNRPDLESVEYEDFFKDYLVRVAGWKPKKLD